MKEIDSTTQAFGPAARLWAGRLPPGVTAIVADITDPAHALAAAAQLRLGGIPYYTTILLDDLRTLVARALAPLILLQAGALEDRRRHFDELAAETLPMSHGVTQQSLVAVDEAALATLRHLYNLSDILLVRSWAEYRRFSKMFSRQRADVRVYAPADPAVPPPPSSPGKRDTIVVWGPDQTATELSLLAFALEEFHAPAIVVCRDGAPQPLRAQFLAAEFAGLALERASVIVDASLGDPGSAIALARHGVPLAVASTSGADEHVAPVYQYDPWSWRSLRTVISIAIGGAPPRPRVESPAVLRPLPQPEPVPEGPLVSIVTPTYNRRDRLPKTMRSWENQRYKNIEVVLVNDGGEPIDDIAAEFPFVRVFNLASNQGIPRALNAGVAEARGEYLLLSSDDDEFAPDHISTIVEALERTGASVGHSNVIIRHEEVLAEGGHRTYGYSLDWVNSVDPSGVLATAGVAITGVIARRSTFFEAGGWDEELPTLRDYHYILALSRRYDFVHVDTTTTVYSSRSDPSSTGYGLREQIATALRMIYSRYPIAGRPSIEAMRQHEIQHYENLGAQALFEPPMRLEP